MNGSEKSSDEIQLMEEKRSGKQESVFRCMYGGNGRLKRTYSSPVYIMGLSSTADDSRREDYTLEGAEIR